MSECWKIGPPLPIARTKEGGEKNSVALRTHHTISRKKGKGKKGESPPLRSTLLYVCVRKKVFQSRFYFLPLSLFPLCVCGSTDEEGRAKILAIFEEEEKRDEYTRNRAPSRIHDSEKLFSLFLCSRNSTTGGEKEKIQTGWKKRGNNPPGQGDFGNALNRPRNSLFLCLNSHAPTYTLSRISLIKNPPFPTHSLPEF